MLVLKNELIFSIANLGAERRSRFEMAEHTPYKILILGASYGSLLAPRCVRAPHLKLVCLPAAGGMINKEASEFASGARDGTTRQIDSRKTARASFCRRPGAVVR